MDCYLDLEANVVANLFNNKNPSKNHPSLVNKKSSVHPSDDGSDELAIRIMNLEIEKLLPTSQERHHSMSPSIEQSNETQTPQIEL